jgi:F-type H+-transporting ATPase subunit epsilon
MAHTIHVDVVSLTESIYSGEAEFVVLPGVMGELGIYPQHAPLITQIKPGEVHIKIPGQEEPQIVFVQGGFLEVQPDVVTVLSDTAIRAHDLDEAKALEAKQRAEDALQNKTSKEEIATAEGELAGAVAQLAAIRRLRGRRS